MVANKDDYQYLHFLKHKYQEFPQLYSREMLVFKDFMSEENFVKWYSDHPQYKFEKGQEPVEGDFSSKEVYNRLMESVNAWQYRQTEPGSKKAGSGN